MTSPVGAMREDVAAAAAAAAEGFDVVVDLPMVACVREASVCTRDVTMVVFSRVREARVRACAARGCVTGGAQCHWCSGVLMHGHRQQLHARSLVVVDCSVLFVRRWRRKRERTEAKV